MGKNLALKAARTEKNMTQKALAQAVGISRQTMNAIESGAYNPTIRLCRKICRILGKGLDDLFWEDEEDEKPVGGIPSNEDRTLEREHKTKLKVLFSPNCKADCRKNR